MKATKREKKTVALDLDALESFHFRIWLVLLTCETSNYEYLYLYVGSSMSYMYEYNYYSHFQLKSV